MTILHSICLHIVALFAYSSCVNIPKHQSWFVCHCEVVVRIHCHGEGCIHTGTRILSSRHDLEAPDHNSSRSIWNNQFCDDLQQEELQVTVSHKLLHSCVKFSSSST